MPAPPNNYRAFSTEQNSSCYHEESQSPYASPLQLPDSRDRLRLECCPGDSHGGGLAPADRVRDEPRYLETDDEEKKPSTRLHSSPTLFEVEEGDCFQS